MTTVSVEKLPLSAVSVGTAIAASPVLGERRRRVTGWLQLTTRGFALRDETGLFWFLDVDSTPTALLGSVVLVEGKRTGLTRLKVDYLGPTDNRGRLQESRVREAGR